MLKLPPAADTSITTKYDHSHGVALLRSYARYRYGAQSTHALASKAHTTSHTALSLVDAPAAGRAQRSLRSVVHGSPPLHTSRASDGPSTPRQANQPSPPPVSHRCTRGSRGCAELVAGVPDAHAAFERALQSTGIGLADVAFFAAMGWSTHAGRSTSVELKEQKW